MLSPNAVLFTAPPHSTVSAFIDLDWAEQVMELVTHTGSVIPDGEAFVARCQVRVSSSDVSNI